MTRNECTNPACRKKFGLMSYFRGRKRYCSEKCKKAHADDEARQRNLRWLQYLRLIY